MYMKNFLFKKAVIHTGEPQHVNMYYFITFMYCTSLHEILSKKKWKREILLTVFFT